MIGSPPETIPAAPQAARAPRIFLAGAALVLAGLLVYANSFRAAFVYDDVLDIAQNSGIRQLWPPGKLLAESGYGTRPLVAFSLALNYVWGGTNPWGYHLFNVLVHLLAGLTLFGVMRRALLAPRFAGRFAPSATGLAFAVALLWVVHPLQTEAVTYIIQRAEALMGLFYLLTVYAFIRSRGTQRQGWWSAAAVAACLLGMASKEVMVSAPLFVLLYDRTFHADSCGGALRRSRGLYAGLAGTWLLLAASHFFSPAPAWAGFGNARLLPVWRYAATEGPALLHYLRLAVWPARLCLDYDWMPVRSLGEFLPAGVFVAALLSLTVLGLIRRSPWGLFGAWFFLILAPTSSFLPIADVVVEHRMYLPLAAVLGAAVLGVHALLSKLPERDCLPRAGRLAAVVLLVAATALLGLKTMRRNTDYYSELAIWTDVVSQRPSNFRARCNLGAVLTSARRFADALEQYQAATEIAPNYGLAQERCGALWLAQGRADEAAAHLRKAVDLGAASAATYCNLGRALGELQQYSQAVSAYREALKLTPRDWRALDQLGNVLAKTGATAESDACHREAARLKAER